MSDIIGALAEAEKERAQPVRTFAQKVKASQPSTPAKAARPGWAHIGQHRAVGSILHLQRAAPPTADPLELEADRAAEAVTDTSDRTGSPLPQSTRAHMERGFGTDFADVRIHTGKEAATAARNLSARAFTVGSDIAFARDAYRPAEREGQLLLAHELAHVVQQRQGSRRLQRKDGTGATISSLADFQQLVKDAGKLRMTANSRALEEWREFLSQQLTPAQVQTQVHVEEIRRILELAGQGGLAETALAERWLQTSGPNQRWVIEENIQGNLKACSGCHAIVQAEQMDRALLEQRGQLLTPLEQFPAGPDLGPRPSFAEGEQIAETQQPGIFPSVAEAQQRLAAIQPYLRQLGPDGYQVLPPETLGSTASESSLVADISRRITQRQADHQEFSRRIAAPDFDYLQLRPIVRDFLPLADPAVRRAVEDAIEAAETWETVESIAVGAATIGLLLLAIFPPTSAIGVTGALALAGGVSAHQIYSGYQSYEQGRLYSMARGAHDVLDPAQQRAADALMAVGALNMIMGSIGVASTTVGTVRLIRSAAPPGGSLGTLEAVEGEAGGTVYRVTGWGTRDPNVVVTGANGKIIREGPLSSFRPSASGGTRATASTGGRTVFPTEGGAARVAEPIPEVIPEPIPAVVPQPVTAPTTPARVPPDVQGPLAVTGATSGVETVAAMGGEAPQKEPVMPLGLSRDKKALWKQCNQLHTKYKATQGEFAALKEPMDPLRIAVQQGRATPQQLLEFCALLNERIAIAERLEEERKRYMDLDCDQFDWFETGTSMADRLKKHRDEWGNVKASIGNIHELVHEYCG